MGAEEKKPLVLYHRVMRRENFEKAAKDIFERLKTAQRLEPGRARILHVDIDGHRNSEGGFDADMMELQTEFGSHFLGPFFTEVHFPIGGFENMAEQRNDIPEKLEIFGVHNEKSSDIGELCIENYSNTEFVSEPEVYCFLEHFSCFLKEYGVFCGQIALRKSGNFWENLWWQHINELIDELFAAFVCGNFLSASAMTRSLIECYVYFGIIRREKNVPLMDEWASCNLCSTFRRSPEKAKDLLGQLCAVSGQDAEKKWAQYKDNKSEQEWLRPVIARGRISFRAACDYLGDTQAYDDFQAASAFVHGADIVSKMFPFAFYESIFNRLHMLVFYSFKTIRMLPVSEHLDALMEELEEELFTVREKLLR